MRENLRFGNIVHVAAQADAVADIITVAVAAAAAAVEGVQVKQQRRSLVRRPHRVVRAEQAEFCEGLDLTLVPPHSNLSLYAHVSGYMLLICTTALHTRQGFCNLRDTHACQRRHGTMTLTCINA
eukprot:771512-Rhodomonas_salina.2